MEHKPTPTLEEQAARRALQDELEEEKREFDDWLAQPVEWPSIP